MKLNADIIFEGLKEKYQIERKGPGTTELTLKRPQFYMDGETVFESDRVYIATAERLPQRPVIRKNAVLVCIGDSVRLSYYQERCTVLHIKERRDFFSVYQNIQEIYDRYDAWNDKLFELFRDDADIQKLLDHSVSLFKKPLLVLDSNFHFIASSSYAGASGAAPWNMSDTALDGNAMGIFLKSGDLSTDVHEPLPLNLDGVHTLCINLFDKKGIYIGCFCVHYSDCQFAAGETALAEYLARMLEQSLERNPLILTNEQTTMKQILRQLIEEMPISPNQRWILNAHHLKTQYVCVSMHVLTPYSQMPLSYIANIFELSFPDSFAFPTGNLVLGFVNLDSLIKTQKKSSKKNSSASNTGYSSMLNSKLVPLLESLKLACGISNDFTDLYDSKIYFRQAEAAYENGIIVTPSTSYHYFSSHVLMEMVTNSLGGLPVETYFPKGLRELLKHDENSGVNYLETLKVFLEENMSYTAASKILYVHRSTLIDRIARIQRDLGIDLDDPNERLHLMILIKAMEIESIIKDGR